jgi:hypothetical protein
MAARDPTRETSLTAFDAPRSLTASGAREAMPSALPKHPSQTKFQTYRLR